MQSEMKQLIDETAKEAMEVFSDSQYEYGRQGVEHMRLALLHKLRSRAGSDAVPPGYKLVPIEPTLEMIKGFWGEITHGAEEIAAAKEAYADMLAAATAPAPESEHRPFVKEAIERIKNMSREELMALFDKHGVEYVDLEKQPERGELPVKKKKLSDLLSPETLEITRKASEARQEVAITPDGPVFINYGDREEQWAEQQAEYDATDWEAETIRLATRVQELEAQLASKPVPEQTNTAFADWLARQPEHVIPDAGDASAPVDEEAERERFEAWYTERYTSYLPMHNGDYSNLDTRLAWKSWQAALATAGGDDRKALLHCQQRLTERGAKIAELHAEIEQLQAERNFAGVKHRRELMPLQARVKSLEGLVAHYRAKDAERLEAVNTLESERAANGKLTAELADSSRLAEAVREYLEVQVDLTKGYVDVLSARKKVVQALAQYEGKGGV